MNLFKTQERVTDVGNKLTVTKQKSSMVSHCTWNKIKTIYWNQVGPSGALLGTNAFLCPLFLVCKEKASAGSHRHWSQKGENAETKEKLSRYNSDEWAHDSWSSRFLSRSCPFSFRACCNKPFLAPNSHFGLLGLTVHEAHKLMFGNMATVEKVLQSWFHHYLCLS